MFEDEEHLLLVYPNTQKVRERFCLALPLTHTSTLAGFMQTTNTVALAKFVACCQYQITIYPPWSTFRLMDSLVPNGHKIINNKQFIYIYFDIVDHNGTLRSHLRSQIKRKRWDFTNVQYFSKTFKTYSINFTSFSHTLWKPSPPPLKLHFENEAKGLEIKNLI